MTILFGTESRIAELVAEEFGTFLRERSGLEISDLASVSLVHWHVSLRSFVWVESHADVGGITAPAVVAAFS